ncbi:MAG: class I SAM-dependent methyltransferase [Vulcanimicrobiaceae bacterium]
MKQAPQPAFAGESLKRAMTFSEFVLSRLHRPSRLLEIGAGSGRLARELVEGGHDVTAIDPEAPEGPGLLRTTFEAFSALPRSFDGVVMQRVLHHLHDLAATLDRVAELLRSDGKLFIDDFAIEKMDERTAQWFWSRWRALGMTRKGPPPDDFDTFLDEWRKAKAECHTGLAMRNALAARFDEGAFEWGPYVAMELGDAYTEPLEREAIARGEIAALGFRYAGALEAI